MHMAENFDVSTLAWVKGEIDETLRQAHMALESFLETPDDTAQLRFCVTYLHQVRGTLQMVELGGAAQVAGEMESLTQALQQGQVEAVEAVLEVLMRAILQLPDYLEYLQSGHPDNPVVLLPIINELRVARGEKPLSSGTFFAPDAGTMPPPSTSRASPAELTAFAKGLRRYYQAGLLQLLKGANTAESLKTLAAVAEKVYRASSDGVLRQWSWVFGAFLEGLREGAVELDGNAKQLLSKGEHVLKIVGESGEAPLKAPQMESFVKAVLFRVAQSRGGGERQAAVRQAFRLDGLVPDTAALQQARVSLGGFNAALKRTVAADIVEELSRVKDALDLFVRSEERPIATLEPLAESLGRVTSTLGLLRQEALRTELETQSAVLQRLLDGTLVADDELLMGIAGAVLAVESALRDWGATIPVEKADAPDEQLPGHEISPQAEAEHRRVVRQVMKEAKEQLVRLRESINTFLSEPQDRQVLEPLPQALHEVIGSLTLLSYKRAALVLRACKLFIEQRLQGAQVLPAGEELDAFADAVMSIEYYMEAFVESRVHPTSVLEVAERAIAAMGYSPEYLANPAPEDSAPGEPLAAENGDTAPAEEDAHEPGARGETAAELSTKEAGLGQGEPEGPMLEESRTEAAPIAETAEESPAELLFVQESAPQLSGADSNEGTLLSAPDFSASEDLAPDFATKPQPQPPASPVPVSPKRTQAPVEVDEEILEIFMEEAEEELGKIAELFPRWRSNNGDTEALRDLRRSFHTLKGSGRLVGATEVGEFAWAFENLLNRIIDATVAPCAAIYDVIEQGQEALPQLLQHFQGGPAPTADVEMLMEAAHEMSKPGGWKAPPPAPASASTPPQEAGGPAEVPELDPVLLEIYSTEVTGHVDQVIEFVRHAKARGGARVSEPLIRALHTLQGSSRMAGVDNIAELAAVLEKYAKTLQGANHSVAMDGLEVLEQAAGFVTAMVAFLNDPVGPLPQGDEIRQRAHRLYDSVSHLEDASLHPEIGLARGEEIQDSGEEFSTKAEEFIAPSVSDEEEGLPSAEGDETPAMVRDAAPEERAGHELDQFEPGAEGDPLPREGGHVEHLWDEGFVFGEMAQDEAGVTPSAGALQAFFEEEGAEEEFVAPEPPTQAHLPEAEELAFSVPGEAAIGGLAEPAAPETQPLEVPESLDGHAFGAVELFDSPEMEAAPELGEVPPDIFDELAFLDDYEVGPPAADQGAAARQRPPPSETETAAAVAPQAAEPVPAAPRDQLEEVDPELLEIFLEEGAEILDASEETLNNWVSRPDDRVLVELLQRQLHTLKGSSRMAGVRPIGELSHSLESTFEAVVEGRLTRSREMFDLLQLAHDRLVRMLEEVREHRPVSSGDDLIGRIESLGRGGNGSPTVPLIEEVPETSLEQVELASADQTAQSLEDAAARLQDALQVWFRDTGSLEWLEKSKAELGRTAEAFRAAGREEASDLCARVERLLEAVMDGHVPFSRELASLVELCAERVILTARHGSVRMDDLAEGVERLLKVRESAPVAAEPAPVPAAGAESAEVPVEKPDGRDENRRRGARVQHEMVRVRSDLMDNLVNFAGEVSIYRSRIEQQIGTFHFNLGELHETVERLREQLRQFDIETEAQIESRYEEAVKQSYDEFDPLEFDRFTHMQQLSRSMLESLSDLMSLEDILGGLTREAETLLLQQARVNTELQETLVHTRMVPLVENAPRLRRVVRQACADLEKQANLYFRGAEVEMDRHVVERMLAPLEHMLRNSIAHGIESVAHRTANGKEASGTIVIAQAREGSEVVIRVIDDGQGINLDAVRKKAQERGLLDPKTELTDHELMQFILESGFSTAQELSQVAGRGVGMDVVNSEIKQLGGALEIDSRPGEGTTFTIRLPLTLSVSRALLVNVDTEIFAVPLMSISGIERVPRSTLDSLLQEESPRYEWLGQQYELLHLSRVLGGQPAPAGEGNKQPILLAQSGDHRVALVVDSLIGSREIVVKSLGPQLSTLQDLAGATILADGRVALILDLPALIRRGLARRAALHAGVPTEVEEKAAEPLVMVVDDSITVRKVTERLLKRNGLRCITAKDGVDALAVLEESIPDVMLLDIEMPRMDGYELATHIRNSEQLKGLPIIMITSRSGEKHRNRALEIGVNVYMSKPYTEADLLDNIAALVGTKA